MKHYKDYIWKEGSPYGVEPIDNPLSAATYKIISDPYRKWISVEQYSDGKYLRTIYDSSLLDFRKLKPMHQNAWEKFTLEETENEIFSMIRDHNDRVILFERYSFEDGKCRNCRVTSPQGQLLSTQTILYSSMGDPFDGVILFDCTDRPVMRKKYKVDELGEFTELVEENWSLDKKINHRACEISEN